MIITMQRYGRILKLKNGAEAEYERYHTNVWPEVLETIRKSGIRNYTIFRYKRWLFSYFELPAEIPLEDVARVTDASEACRKWEKIMHSLQEPLPESGPENWWVPMKEVFQCGYIENLHSGDLGAFMMSPAGPFEAGSYVTIVFRIIIGKAGLKRGGCVKICTPNMGWGEPHCITPHHWHEMLVETDRRHNPWKPLNTTWSLRSKQGATIHLRADENIAGSVHGHRTTLAAEIAERLYGWRWWLTATVERADLVPGDELCITYGDTKDCPFGIRVQPWPEENQLTFAAVIDAKGDQNYRILAAPVDVNVLPGPPERISAFLPSFVRPGETAVLRINVLDRNLCPANAPFTDSLSLEATEGVALSAASVTGMPAQIMATPEAEGIVRVKAVGPETAMTNPLVVDKAKNFNLYWGDLHAQSKYHQWRPEIGRGDSTLSPVELHAYARDCAMLDFVAITDGSGAYAVNPGWEETQQAAKECYVPGRYVAFKGWEYGMNEQGDKCVIYRSAEIEPHIPRMTPSENAPSAAHALINFYKHHREQVLTIPHSFMKYLDWSVMDPGLDRLMEIYSCWGSYESRTDNPLNSKRQPMNQSAQHALRMGYILGITAAGDSHVGYPGRSLPFADRNECQCFKAGLCAVYADKLTRENLWDALYERRCYGTTGVRIVLDFKLNNAIMGTVLEYAADDEALRKRKIVVRVAGTDYIRRVDVLKNNALLHRENPNGDHAEFILEDILHDPPKTRDWYYVRVFQADGNAAWSSPIWVGPAGCITPTPTNIE